MKKIICLFVLLALAPGAHADDKKKKPAGNSSHPSAPGGGGGRRAPSTSRGGMGQMGGSHSNNAHNIHAGQSSSNRLESRSGSGGHGSNAGPRSAGQSRGGDHSSNPLTRKGGQAGSNAHGSNPLMRNNGKAGPKSSNPLAKKNGPQNSMNGRNGKMLTNNKGANMRGNRALGGPNGRGNNRLGARNWQRGAHANYRVRPYREVFRNYRPIYHDRFWYTSHFDRVVIVGGGYYYWDAGYWYPAWGYDPAIAVYAYDGPIYSYDNLPPDQVTVNVQTELQDEGYYTGEVDGQLGPQTRDALGAYQADHDLEVTSAVDEPTVESLGLTEST